MAMLVRVPKEATPMVTTVATVCTALFVVPAVVVMVASSTPAIATFGTIMLGFELHRKYKRR